MREKGGDKMVSGLVWLIIALVLAVTAAIAFVGRHWPEAALLVFMAALLLWKGIQILWAIG